jgi:hypothetical protein
MVIDIVKNEILEYAKHFGLEVELGAKIWCVFFVSPPRSSLPSNRLVCTIEFYEDSLYICHLNYYVQPNLLSLPHHFGIYFSDPMLFDTVKDVFSVIAKTGCV